MANKTVITANAQERKKTYNIRFTLCVVFMEIGNLYCLAYDNDNSKNHLAT